MMTMTATQQQPAHAKFSELVRATRIERGMTIAALAAAVGYDPSYFSMVERGLRRIEEEAVVRTALVLGIDPTVALLSALREKLPAEMKRFVPAELHPEDASAVFDTVRRFQSEDHDFEIQVSRLEAAADWDGNVRITRTIEDCRPNASGRPVGELSFSERLVGAAPGGEPPKSSFKVLKAPKGLEFEATSERSPTGFQHRLRFPRGWKRTPQAREDAFSFSFEDHQEKGLSLETSEHIKNAEREGFHLRLPLQGTLGVYVRHLIRRLEVTLEFPKGYVPEKWEAWSWWGAGALEGATRNLSAKSCQSLKTRFQSNRAELTAQEPLLGYTVALVWTPLDFQRYLEARYGGSK